MQTLTRLMVLSAVLVRVWLFGAWRQASESELKSLIPARAPVEKEQIETEFRTASGITNGKGKFIAGVVLITAGYAAEGKYSNFLIVQSAMKIGSMQSATRRIRVWLAQERRRCIGSEVVRRALRPIFRRRRKRHRLGRNGRIESFKVSPPGDKSIHRDRALWYELLSGRVVRTRVDRSVGKQLLIAVDRSLTVPSRIPRFPRADHASDRHDAFSVAARLQRTDRKKSTHA